MRKPLAMKLPMLSAALLVGLALTGSPVLAQSEDMSGHEGHLMPPAQTGGMGAMDAGDGNEAMGAEGVGGTAVADDDAAADDAPASAVTGSGMAMGGGYKCRCAMHGTMGGKDGGHGGHGKGGGGHGGRGKGGDGGHGMMAHGGRKGGGHGGHGKGEGDGGKGHGKDAGGPPLYGDHWKESLTAVQKAELDRLHLELARVKAPMKAMTKALKVQIAVLSTSPQPQADALETAIAQVLDAEREMLRAEVRHTAAQRAVLTPEQQVSFDLHTIHQAMHGKGGMGGKGGKGHGGGH